MENFDLNVIIQPLRKWWWLLLAAALLAVLSSTFYLMRQPSLYQSSTTLMVGSFIQDPNPSGNEFFLAQQLADTYASFLQRGAIRQATMQALGMDWLPDYSARAEAQLLEITVTDLDPQRAQRVAQELAKQLIEQGPAGQAQQGHQGFVSQRLQKLETDIVATEDEVGRKQIEMANELSASKIARLQSEITVLSAKVDTLQSIYAALLATTQRGASNAIRVLEAAGLPQQPISSSSLTYVLVAALFGLVLAGGSAYLIEYLDDSVRTVEQIERVSGAPTLGAIPILGDANADNDEKLIMLHNTLGPTAEAYRVLRTNLQFASVDHPLRTLQVTSPSAGEGKSITAANLSAALAFGGMRVILIDADFRRPQQHKLFKLANNLGVTSALLGNLEIVSECVRATPVPNLRILTSGPLPPNPSELLGSKRMQHLLATLQEQADIIVIDSPPVTVVSDTAVIASRVDGVLMVIKAGHTRREVARHAFQALKQVNARVLGAVLNEVSGKESGYYFSSDSNYDYAYSHKRGSGSSPGRNRDGQRAKIGQKHATDPVSDSTQGTRPGHAGRPSPAPSVIESNQETAVP